MGVERGPGQMPGTVLADQVLRGEEIAEAWVGAERTRRAGAVAQVMATPTLVAATKVVRSGQIRDVSSLILFF